MSVDVLLGLQWGDEGKGKIVDFIAPKYKVVARFQGGPNAGHTLEFDGIKHVLHQIPSGIFRPEIKNYIGNGVVLDPVVFKKEIGLLSKFNIDFKKSLFISKRTQLIIPTHKLLDAASEKSKGEGKIGSTLKGIGPTYADKISRNGLRVGDILSPDFRAKYQHLVDQHKTILEFYKFEYELESIENEYFEALEFLKGFNLVDCEYQINKDIANGDSILAEGAQGSLLDIDFGTYPFVTSSNTMTAGACTGLGVAPKHIGKVYGIFKAYCTRVGSGPFPTELLDETGEKMRKIGNEFGSTTGRPRRCGWLDLPALKYAVMLNGVSELLMMKADVLNDFDELKICTHYKTATGELLDYLPYDINTSAVTPVYTTLKGWKCATTGYTSFNDLTPAFKEYVGFIEKSLGLPITLISLGPDRTETILK